LESEREIELDNLDTTNRFKLIGELGGKCRICLEDKIEKLEADHIYNDGAEERGKYGSSEKIYGWYLQHMDEAFKRIQPLCKDCHRTKHSCQREPEVDLRILRGTMHSKVSKMQLFMDIIKSLEGENKLPVEIPNFLFELENTSKFTKEEAVNYIKRMLREASIYESKPGYLNRV